QTQPVRGMKKVLEKVLQDPVCGMTVTPEKAAATAEYDGKLWHFCCKGCAAKFAADPEKYASGAAKPHHTHSAMVQLGAAPAAPPVAKEGERVEYTCPMHPEVVAYRPGPCPICGMALELRVATGEQDDTELRDMERRLWISAALTLPLFLIAMAEMFTAFALGSREGGWIQLLLATPVVLWA